MENSAHTPTPYHRNIKPASKYTTIWSGRNDHIAYMATGGRNPEQVENDMDFIIRACNSHDDLVAALERLLDCPDLNLGNLEEETILAIQESQAVLAKAAQS